MHQPADDVREPVFTDALQASQVAGSSKNTVGRISQWTASGRSGGGWFASDECYGRSRRGPAVGVKSEGPRTAAAIGASEDPRPHTGYVMQ